ncbi:MAG: chemotaxis protein CheW [Pseudomonadota bacterium]
MNNLRTAERNVQGGVGAGTRDDVEGGAAKSGGTQAFDDVKSDRSVTEEDKRRILRERARQLARKRDADAENDEASLVVIGFRLGDERYAVEVEFVREVYALRDLTPVPCTPRFVLGIINVRGQVVSVTDTKVLFGLPDNVVGLESRVLILSDQVMEMGILVDEVYGEQRIPVDKIQSQLPAPKGIRREYIRGVTQDRLVILDGAALLCDDNIVVHEDVGD